MSECAEPLPVLLVHGIWNAKVWLLPFAQRLRAEGLAPRLFGYTSVFGTPERAAERLIAHLRARPVASVIGHSLGGLIALEALRGAPELAVERVVCVGSPLSGSAAARGLARRPPLSLLLGRSSALLQQGCPPWQGPAAVGAIAGDRPHGLGRLFADLDERSDGTVAIAETRLPGLADHCVVPASHSGLVLSAAAAREAAHFLRHGRFVAGPDA